MTHQHLYGLGLVVAAGVAIYFLTSAAQPGAASSATTPTTGVIPLTPTSFLSIGAAPPVPGTLTSGGASLNIDSNVLSPSFGQVINTNTA